MEVYYTCTLQTSVDMYNIILYACQITCSIVGGENQRLNTSCMRRRLYSYLNSWPPIFFTEWKASIACFLKLSCASVSCSGWRYGRSPPHTYNTELMMEAKADYHHLHDCIFYRIFTYKQQSYTQL